MTRGRGGEGGGGEGEREAEEDDRGWKCTQGRVRRGEGRERISLTMKRDFTDRCTYVHQHVRGEKGTGIIHYDSSFRNNNEARRSHAFVRDVEFYIWDTSSPRKETETSPTEYAFL